MTGYIETWNGYDLYRDDDGAGGSQAWYALPEFPRDADGESVGIYPSRRALRRAIDATYRAPGAAS